MQALRQMGGGVFIAVISLFLVVGGISLALAESKTPAEATPTPLPPVIATSLEQPTLSIPTATLLVIETSTNTPEVPTLQPSATLALAQPVVCNSPSGWIQIIVSANDTLYTIAERYKTTAEALNNSNCLNNTLPAAGSLLYVPPVPTVTVIPCGPPAGWVKNHAVQSGDTLFRIALSYGITYPQVQRANCMGSSTTIYPNQLLWVPNVPTHTPGVTLIPNFPTITLTPTFTSSPVPPSDTSVPPTITPSFTPQPEPTTPVPPAAP